MFIVKVFAGGLMQAELIVVYGQPALTQVKKFKQRLILT
jgi:hypothetical protein